MNTTTNEAIVSFLPLADVSRRFFMNPRDKERRQGNKFKKNVIWLYAIDMYVFIYEWMGMWEGKFIGKVFQDSSCSVEPYSI